MLARKALVVPMSLLVGLAPSGCTEAPTPNVTESLPSTRATPTPPAEPWTLVEPPADTDGLLRILIYHDMEGLSGQDDPTSFEFGKPLYATGRELLVGDVNAVIEGLFEGGADEVHVVDGHGSGNPDPDLLLDRLDPRAEMTFRDAAFDAYGDLPEPARFDAIAVVGMHAKTGSGGFASHTFTLGMDILFNGRSITETELIAFSWGRYDTPVIFGSGDDRLAADLETMPWIEFVTVKTATSASTAELRPIDEARADLRAGAARAVRNLAAARAMRLTAPGDGCSAGGRAGAAGSPGRSAGNRLRRRYREVHGERIRGVLRRRLGADRTRDPRLRSSAQRDPGGSSGRGRDPWPIQRSALRALDGCGVGTVVAACSRGSPVGGPALSRIPLSESPGPTALALGSWAPSSEASAPPTRPVRRARRPRPR